MKIDKMDILLVCLALFVILILFSMWEDAAKDFNPDKDVCLEWTCLNCTLDNFKANCLQEGCYAEYCSDWIPKNKCQLDPNAEGCVCDEYEEITARTLNPILRVYSYKNESDFLKNKKRYDSTKVFLIVDGESFTWSYNEYIKLKEYIKEEIDYINFKIERDGIEEVSVKSCIKSHLPNECEKENPDYVWDYDFECVTEENGTLNLETGETIKYKLFVEDKNKCFMRKTKPFCRPKKIEDYPCEELKKHLYLNENIRLHKDLWVCVEDLKFLPCATWKTGYNLEEIYDAMKTKGCNI